ncbi:hypothetical protein GCM10009609_30270 [Pseudonocardia aurantiaca]
MKGAAEAGHSDHSISALTEVLRKPEEARNSWRLSCGSWDRLAETDPDGGDVNGAAEHVVAFVVTGRDKVRRLLTALA